MSIAFMQVLQGIMYQKWKIAGEEELAAAKNMPAVGLLPQ